MKDILIAKLRNHKENINCTLELIADCNRVNDASESAKFYLNELYKFLNIRKKVVLDRKIYLWIKEIFLWLIHSKYIGFRYCLIDLLSSLNILTIFDD